VGSTANGEGAVYRIDLSTGSATLFAGPRTGDTNANNYPRPGASSGPALGTTFTDLVDLEVAPDGDLLLLERWTNASFSDAARVWRVHAGVATVIAGTTDLGAPLATDHAPPTTVRLASADGIGVAPDGTIYVAGTRIYRLDTSGDLTLFAGTGVSGTPAGDGGQAIDATFQDPADVLAAADGTVYVSDSGIRAIAPDRTISTLASSEPTRGLTFAPDGGIVAGGRYSHQVVHIALDGTKTLMAGSGGNSFNGDGVAATVANLWVPADLAYDGAGRLLIDAALQRRVRLVDAGGTISTVFGNGQPMSLNVEASAPSGWPVAPTSLAVDATGRLIAANPTLARVRRLDSDGKVRTIAGNGTPGYSGDGGPGILSRIGSRSRVAVGPDGTVYISDFDNDRVRKVVGGTISTAVSTFAPTGITTGADGSVYWVSIQDLVVHRLHPDGSQSTIPYEPGAAPHPGGGLELAMDPGGNLFVLVVENLPDGNNTYVRRIVRIDTAGSVSTVIGGSTFGFSGDGGPAIDAQLAADASGLATGPDGSLYIADTDNNRVRRITPDGRIDTIAGTGVGGPFGDGGPATGASTYRPQSIAVDGAGRVFVGTPTAVRVVEPATSWVRPLGGATNDDATDVRVMPDGAVAVVGRFTGTMTLGLPPASTSLTSAGGTDGFVAVYEPTGRLRWAQRIWGPGTDDARSVAVDAAGNLVVSGTIGTTATFGTGAAAQSRNALADAYVAKYSSAGALAWVRTVTGTGSEVGAAVDVDAVGNVWLAGTFSSAPASAGSTTLTNAGGIDGFVARYSASGNLWFSAPVGGPGVDTLRSVAARPDGSAAVGGYFSGTAMVGRSGPSVVSGGGTDGLVAVFGPIGAVLWKSTINGPSTDWVSGVAVTAAGDVAVSGAFSGTASAGAAGPLVAASGMDGLVARFTATGTASWAVRFGGTGADNGVDVAVDGSQFLVAGVVSSSTSIGGTSIGGAGGYDGFTARLADGAAAPPFTGATAVATGAGSGLAASIAARAGGLVVGGSFTGVASFGSGASSSLVSTGTDGFVFLG
jgi:hypothetical protein